MGKDGIPYCEKCYQQLFGVKCAYCNRYISGKVLQAGENHHFHPTCARCTKCGDPFGDGEEMYLQGSAGNATCFSYLSKITLLNQFCRKIAYL